MTNELHRHAGLAVQGLLERENDEHFPDEFLQDLDSTFAAGPDLRAHVVKRGNGGVLRHGKHAPIEAIVVDANQRGWPALGEKAIEPPAQFKQKGNLQQRFPEAGHPARGEVLDELVRHFTRERPAHRRDASRRVLTLERPDQVRRVDVARGVAGHDEKERGSHRESRGSTGERHQRFPGQAMDQVAVRDQCLDGIVTVPDTDPAEGPVMAMRRP